MKNKNFTQGPVFRALMIYSFPLIVTRLVQIFFHAADVAVLGIMADDAAVAAVGACGTLIHLMVSLFTALATGANVLISHRVGSGDREGARRAVGTALVISFLSGVLLMIVAVLGARQFLIWMNCQEEILDQAATYLRIYFMGMPVIMMYNFSAAILRSVGDSMRPMIYMVVAGSANVVLNVLFIVVLKLTVEGVALATVCSNFISLILALKTLSRDQNFCRVEKKNLRLRKEELFEIVRVGIPAGISGMFYYVSNVVIATQVNGISTDAMTANAISGQFDGVIYQIGCAIASATMVMVGQNMGAGQVDRVRRCIRSGLFYATAASLAAGVVFVMFAEPLLGIMTDSAEVIAIGKSRMCVLCLSYFVTSIMEVFSFSLRAMKKSFFSMVVGGICGFGVRVFWAVWIWPYFGSLGMLYAAFTVSAACAVMIYVPYYFKVIKKALRLQASAA